jgi:3-oxoadipate enol-lactonase
MQSEEDITNRESGENLKVKSNDLLVNYNASGPVFAPVVLMVHGTPFNKGIWDLQVEALKSNYRVIAYDLRGHGGTTCEGAEKPLSIDLFTEDLVAFMDVLGIQKAILCGISLGGYIALDAIEKHPERFNALVLAATQCGIDSPEVMAERSRLIALLDKGGMDAYADEAMKHWFAPNSFTTRKEEVRAVRNMALATHADAVRNTLHALSARRETCGNLWSIPCPALILTGKEDVITPPEAAAFMRENISGSSLHLIEYAGHLANLENTHEFNSLLRRFVDKVCEKKHLSRHCTGDARAEAKKALVRNSG